MTISIASDADHTVELAGRVREATARRTPLRIVGGNTKEFYGRRVEGERLDVSAHRGVISYDPSELVITARAGTPLAEVEALLADHNQMLAFEPPVFGAASTFGGVVAAGLAGSRRPFAGAVRDFVLGVTVMNGHGEALRLGGTVFKNVAGFDGFRLMSGALGTLGVLLDISFRVVPRPEVEVEVSLAEAWPLARRRLLAMMSRQTPLSGACHHDETLHLRLSGSERVVATFARSLGAEPGSPKTFSNLRYMSHPNLPPHGKLWRLSLPPAREVLTLSGSSLIDWAGAQVWLHTDATAIMVREACASVGGHATLFRGAEPSEAVFTPLTRPMLALHKRLKLAFDPAGVFNPGRMYEGL